MSDVGQIERRTQNRVVKLFRERLGYRYLGNRQYHTGNSNIEQEERPGIRLRSALVSAGTELRRRALEPCAMGGC